MNLRFVKCVDYLLLCSSEGLEKPSCPSTSTSSYSELVTMIYSIEGLRHRTHLLTPLDIQVMFVTPWWFCWISYYLEKREVKCIQRHIVGGKSTDLPSVFDNFPSHQPHRIVLSDLDGFLCFLLVSEGFKRASGYPSEYCNIYGRQIQKW